MQESPIFLKQFYSGMDVIDIVAWNSFSCNGIRFLQRVKDNDCDRIVKGTFLYLLPRRQGMEIRGGVPPSEVCLSMKMVFVASM